MKKVLLISLTFVLAIGLTACGETKEEKVEKAVDKTVDQMVDMAENAGETIDPNAKEMMKEVLNNNESFQQEMASEMDQLPKIAKVARFYRDCLADADSKGEAIECYEDADDMADDLGIVGEDDEALNADEEFGDWTPESKKRVLMEMDEGLKYFEQMNQ